MIMVMIAFSSYAQSDVEKILKGGEILLSGLSILKKDKAGGTVSESGIIPSVCIKNKLSVGISFILVGKEPDSALRKDMVIPEDGKECIFELPNGIYAYEILLKTGEVYKKGEIKLVEELTVTVK